MAPSIHVTITADIGPGKSTSATHLNKVTRLEADVIAGILRIWNDNNIHEFELAGVSNFTDTITGGTHEIVIS